MKKMTLNEFIEKAQLIHNYKYDYNESQYINAKILLKIKCPIHDVFIQRPYKHLSGSGCPKCGLLKSSAALKTTLTEFVERSNLVHNYKYDYSKAEYHGSKEKITIICYLHGEFSQNANDHLNGHGCSLCAIEKNTNKLIMSFQQFIQKAHYVHENKYIYDELTFNNNEINITCPVHGLFVQKRNVHLNGHGCRKCANNFPLTKEDVIKRGNKTHNNFYNYLDVMLDSKKIKIECPKHGIFMQNIHDHCAGHGCSKCHHNISIKETQWLDDLYIVPEFRQYLIRIGAKRYKVDGFDPDTNTIYEFYGDYWHGNPEVYKSEDINSNTKTSFGHLYSQTIKKEQELIDFGFNMVTKWESDYIYETV